MNKPRQANTPINIAVNGSGTIGRAVIIEMLKRPTSQFNIVAVNDQLAIDQAAKVLEHIFHERFGEMWRVEPNAAQKALSFTSPQKETFEIPYFKADGTLPWKKVDAPIDIVMECSGAYRTRELLEQHQKAGARKVLLSARSSKEDDVDTTVVYGINEETITADTHLVSNSSCTTNAAAHVLKVIYDHYGFMTCDAVSIHVPLNRHHAYDHGANVEEGYDSVFGIANNAIPRECSLGSLAPRILGKEFNGRIMANTITVPIKGGSLMQMSFSLPKTEKTAQLARESINALFKDYAKSMPHDQVFRVFDREGCSARAKRTPYSAILDANLTDVLITDNAVALKVGVWHDTAWGFAPRMLDVAQEMFEAQERASFVPRAVQSL